MLANGGYFCQMDLIRLDDKIDELHGEPSQILLCYIKRLPTIASNPEWTGLGSWWRYIWSYDGHRF